jgi:hypothetical protein
MRVKNHIFQAKSKSYITLDLKTWPSWTPEKTIAFSSFVLTLLLKPPTFNTHEYAKQWPNDYSNHIFKRKCWRQLV